MPTFDIYQGAKKIDFRDFNSSFWVLADTSNRIYWGSDWEKEERGHILVIWVQYMGMVPGFSQNYYRLNLLAAEWQLILDNNSFPLGYLKPVNLTGKKVCLQYGEFEFICQFPEID